MYIKFVSSTVCFNAMEFGNLGLGVKQFVLLDTRPYPQNGSFIDYLRIEIEGIFFIS